MKNNKCFCPLTNTLIERSLCFSMCDNRNIDVKIKQIPNYKDICKRCKYRKVYDDDITINLSEIKDEIKRLDKERSDVV